MVNWYEEVQRREEKLLHDMDGLLRIPSVKQMETSAEGAPMGKEIGRALEYMLDLSSRDGFRIANLEGYVGYAELGDSPSDDYIAVLGHLDVVAATGEWTSPPYEPKIREGRLYARGAIDDKGPMLAAYYGLKIVKELGLPLRHKIRFIFGTDEESGSRCMARYRETEKLPLAGFTPDADFPIVHAEKGQINTRVMLAKAETPAEWPADEQPAGYLRSFYGGGTANMVPESARAVIAGEAPVLEHLACAYRAYCEGRGRKGTAQIEAGQIVLAMEGKAAHGMEPHLGVNAALELIHFLAPQSLQPDAERFLACVDTLLFEDYGGVALGIAFADEISGALTINSGILQFEPLGESFFHINLRYPVTDEASRILEVISERVGKYGFVVEPPLLKKGHHVAKDHPMIRILQQIYQETTGEEPTLLSTGGGTYAYHIGNGVAFGPLFPGKTSLAHQADEYIEVEDLLLSAAMYARAIYEMANAEYR
ncbi:dipeptidase PepV [Brevibacillus choshinensis]|uniref:Dipeptidase PepV n=1 Tax=Brevibacillus choshinensis TaxID=54911 RepID=A0ABX7FTR7_BRECH|nr:dipeptidase PepV [Brevibacillus choshinensis]QRG68365.1 dipeptidase PepV [Brevibacillus choshinensis]